VRPGARAFFLPVAAIPAQAKMLRRADQSLLRHRHQKSEKT
jgi:hypothetical protein